MSHASFLARHIDDLGNAAARDSEESHIVFSRGVFYSYGSHYPLLFKVGGKVFVNVRGYSPSTAKHICRARVYARHAVVLQRHACTIADNLTPAAVRESLRAERADIAKHPARPGTIRHRMQQTRTAQIDEALADLFRARS